MDHNYAPTVEILTWFMLITAVLGVAARSLTKAIIIRSLNPDDYLISISLLFAIGQSVAVTIQTGHNYANSTVTMDQSQLAVDLKSEYVAASLYIASLGFAKASVLALVKNITPVRGDRRVVYGLAGLILLWTTSAEFATAFLCDLPRPWDYLHGQCHERGMRRIWWNYFEVTNIITDMALMLVPLMVIWKIRTSITKKVSVFSFFALRTTVIAASACKLFFWNRDEHLQEPGLDSWTVTICTQAIQCLSIVSACFLYLKPFLDSVGSGFMRSDDIRRRGTSNYYYGHTTGDSSALRSAFLTSKSGRQGSDAIALENISSGYDAANVTTGEPVYDEDVESHHSRSRIIQQTRTLAVEGSA